ncbi:MAG TPA: hypothetical protein VNQ99_04450 [Xanthobacteraceae bacterium]|nr:hypothetical protein [Xanthobacteraceae bacterium]
MSVNRSRRQTLTKIFAWPLVIGVLSITGLIAALVGDGIWDRVSWATLLLPSVLYVVFLLRPFR